MWCNFWWHFFISPVFETELFTWFKIFRKIMNFRMESERFDPAFTSDVKKKKAGRKCSWSEKTIND